MDNPEKMTLASVVGDEVYTVWIEMLRTLVPTGRTHRLVPLIATMLQYAHSKSKDDPNNEVAIALQRAIEWRTNEEPIRLLRPILIPLFREATVSPDRVAVDGTLYGIIEPAVMQYITWFNMPWE